MKIFKTNNLAMEVKENQIRILEQELLQEKHSSSLKENTISRLTKSIEDKDRQIEKLWKEKTEVILEKNQYFKTITQAADENVKLKKELERLKNGIEAETIQLNISYEDHVSKHLTRVNGWKPYKEHVCIPECFKGHVLPAIQKDYESIDTKQKQSWFVRNEFLEYWKAKIMEEYRFVDSLYVVGGKIKVTFK